MNINEARTYLIAKSKPEYYAYIETQLAGDFAVEVAEKMLAYNLLIDSLYKGGGVGKMKPSGRESQRVCEEAVNNCLRLNEYNRKAQELKLRSKK